MSSTKFTTPVGIAVYPHLNRPDTKFHDLGIYKADVKVSVEEAQPLMATLMAFYKENVGTAANKFDNTMFSLETDEDGEPTGDVTFKLRVKNRNGRDGSVWDRKPKMFDASLVPCPNANPFGGSTIAVNFEAYAWNMSGKKGVSLQPVAVQILKLKEGGNNDNASSFGFTATEGFQADSVASEFVATAPVASSDDSDDGDF